MYPLTGQTVFLLGSPWLRHVEIALDAEGSRKVKITSTVSGNDEDEGYHVQRVRLNGHQWEKSWLEWSDLFAEGGTLEFELGATPRAWAMGPAPPSPASEGEGSDGGDSGGVARNAADHGDNGFNHADDGEEKGQEKGSAGGRGNMALIGGGVVGGLALLSLVVAAYVVSRRRNRTRKCKKAYNEVEVTDVEM